MDTSNHKQGRFARILTILVAGNALAGCGGFSFQTSSSPSQTNSAAAEGARGPVAQVYESWTYESCGPSDWCGVKLAAAAGIQPDGQRGGALDNPKPSMDNPDPEWLPGWDQLPEDERGARDVFEALSLAAVRKSWSKECGEQYRTVKRQLDERLAKTKEALAAARSLRDPHARLQALLAIPERPSAAQSKLDEFREGFDAAAFEAERAIAEELRDQDKLWLLDFEPVTLSGNAREVLAPRWPSDLEETAFCMHAARHGHGELPPLSDSAQPSVERIRELVKPVFSEAQKRAIAEEQEKRAANATRALGYADAKRPEKLRQLATSSSHDIVSFEVKNGRAVVKMHERRQFNRSSGELCVDGQRIGRCPSMRVTKDEHRTIEFSSWPKDLVLNEGDVLTFFGIVEERTVSGSGTTTEKWVERIAGLHVQSVKKKDGTEKQFLVGNGR